MKVGIEPPVTGGDGGGGKDSNLPIVQKKLQDSGLLKNNPNLRAQSVLDENGKERITLSGEINAEDYSTLKALLDELNKMRGIKLDAVFVNTVEHDTAETVRPDAAPTKDKFENLPRPLIHVEATFSKEELHSTQALGNPWLKPNGLLALQRAIIELSVVQSQIKMDSSEFWVTEVKEVVSLAQDMSSLILESAKLDAQRHRVEGDAHWKQAMVHLGTALIQGVTLFMTLKSAKSSKGKVKKLRNNPSYKNALKTKKQIKSDQKKDDATFGKDTKTATQKEVNTAKQKQTEATLKFQKKRMQNKDNQASNKEVKKAQKEYNASNKEVLVKEKGLQKAQAQEKIDQRKMKLEQDKDYQAYKQEKAALVKQSGEETHLKSMAFNQFSGIVGSFSQVATNMIEAKKSYDLAAITEQKGIVDSTMEVIRAMKDLAQKGVEQSDRDRKESSEIMSSALQMLTQIQEKASRMGISLRGGA